MCETGAHIVSEDGQASDRAKFVSEKRSQSDMVIKSSSLFAKSISPGSLFLFVETRRCLVAGNDDFPSFIHKQAPE